MPSMQEALTAAMQQQIKQTVADWSDDNTQPTQEKPVTDNQTQETVGVTRAVFNYVNSNPGRTRVEVCSALTAQGYKLNSISSLINQNLRCGNFTDRDGMLYSNYSTYRPIHSAAKYMPQTKVKAKTVKSTKAAHVTAGAPTAADLRNALDVIKQSKALYEELHKIFGDKA